MTRFRAICQIHGPLLTVESEDDTLTAAMKDAAASNHRDNTGCGGPVTWMALPDEPKPKRPTTKKVKATE